MHTQHNKPVTSVLEAIDQCELCKGYKLVFNNVEIVSGKMGVIYAGMWGLKDQFFRSTYTISP